ncbi:MAG: NUDIX hydrolase [Nanoarchaeota archaeon]
MEIDPEFQNLQLPAVAVDVLLFSIIHEELHVGLVQRHDEPYKGGFALPGRFVRYAEPIEETARQVLELKCKVPADSVYMEQLYTFGQDLERDTRIRTISIVYFGIVASDNRSLEASESLHWHAVDSLPTLAFDHKQITEYALGRLQNKVRWGDAAFRFLPREFTLTQLQKVYEAVLGYQLDKRNFRKKIREKVHKTNHTHREGAHRPAALYRYQQQKDTF